MSDLEKGVSTHNHATTVTNVNNGTKHTSDVTDAPYTLSATAVRQALFQGADGSPFRKFANPGPLGLFSFASTTLILSLVNVNAHSVNTPNIVIGMAIFVGGLVQLLAGMWEFACGNTLGATAFSSYGGFWLAYATIFIPGSGIITSYQGTNQLDPAVGFFLATWLIFTFCMFLASLRANVTLMLLFFFLTLTFLFLTIGSYISNPNINKAGGGFGIITAFVAYYAALAQVLIPGDHFVYLPLGPYMGKKRE